MLQPKRSTSIWSFLNIYQKPKKFSRKDDAILRWVIFFTRLIWTRFFLKLSQGYCSKALNCTHGALSFVFAVFCTLGCCWQWVVDGRGNDKGYGGFFWSVFVLATAATVVIGGDSEGWMGERWWQKPETK